MPRCDVSTLQGFDGVRLSRLIRRLTSATEQEHRVFKNVRTGKPIFSDSMVENREVSPELDQLAVYCRGNFGLAIEYWRARLKAEPDSGNSTSGGLEFAVTSVPERCVWVANMPKEPVLPSAEDEGIAFLIHALLLHNGLPDDVLTELLPFPHHRIISLLLELKAIGIVTERKGAWRITALGYVSAREYLRVHDFIVDDF